MKYMFMILIFMSSNLYAKQDAFIVHHFYLDQSYLYNKIPLFSKKDKEKLKSLNPAKSLYFDELEPDALTLYILEKLPGSASAFRGTYPNRSEVPESYARELSWAIIEVSRCVRVDPFVFAALVGHESRFVLDARSHTGALGLGQLTSIALAEIAQQFWAPGTRRPGHSQGHNVGVRNTKYSLNNIIEECIIPLSEYSSYGQFEHIWDIEARMSGQPERIALAQRRHSETSKAIRSNMILNLTYSAIYFAITTEVAGRRVGESHRWTINHLERALNQYNAASRAEQQRHAKATKSNLKRILQINHEYMSQWAQNVKNQKELTHPDLLPTSILRKKILKPSS